MTEQLRVVMQRARSDWKAVTGVERAPRSPQCAVGTWVALGQERCESPRRADLPGRRAVPQPVCRRIGKGASERDGWPWLRRQCEQQLGEARGRDDDVSHRDYEHVGPGRRENGVVCLFQRPAALASVDRKLNVGLAVAPGARRVDGFRRLRRVAEYDTEPRDAALGCSCGERVECVVHSRALVECRNAKGDRRSVETRRESLGHLVGEVAPCRQPSRLHDR
jgi:hypothetical protein